LTITFETKVFGTPLFMLIIIIGVFIFISGSFGSMMISSALPSDPEDRIRENYSDKEKMLDDILTITLQMQVWGVFLVLGTGLLFFVNGKLDDLEKRNEKKE